MNILIKSCNIADPSSPFNGKICDVLIVDGIIRKIDATLSEDAQQIEANGKYLSPGFFS